MRFLIKNIPAKHRAQLRNLRRRLFETVGSDRYSRLAGNALDTKLQSYLDFEGGSFVEVGANDGLSQSNTYWFERFRNWRGVLIEPIPDLYRQCVKNRPKAKVFNAALVDDPAQQHVTMQYAGLMSLVDGAFGSRDADVDHVAKAVTLQSTSERVLRPYTIEVAARTLSSILSEVGMKSPDLLSLDVEGFECQALRGLDLNLHRPRMILVEARNVADVDGILLPTYDRVDKLTSVDYLYRAR